MYTDLISDLREETEWAKGNEWETPIMLSDHLTQAINAIEAQDRHILTLQQEMMAEAESHIAEINRLNKQIEELQANVRPVVYGHWISTKEAEDMGDIMKEFTCSVCGCCEWDCTKSESFNFCPNCGADMREQSKEKRV